MYRSVLFLTAFMGISSLCAADAPPTPDQLSILPGNLP